jgi:hypothetical protein
LLNPISRRLRGEPPVGGHPLTATPSPELPDVGLFQGL